MTVGIVESAKRVLSMPVRTGIPTGISGLIDDLETPAYSTPVGILRYALTQSNEESGLGMMINSEKFPLKGALSKISGILKSLLP